MYKERNDAIFLDTGTNLENKRIKHALKNSVAQMSELA